VRQTFLRESAIVGVAEKKKYRIAKDVGLKIRNMIVLISQAFPLLVNRLSVEQLSTLVNNIGTNNSADSDWLEILDAKPRKFAISMLRSQRIAAHRDIVQRQQASLADVKKEEQEVRAARQTFLSCLSYVLFFFRFLFFLI
jgi:hypothetical protein